LSGGIPVPAPDKKPGCLAVIAGLSLAACAATTGIIPLGDDVLMIERQAPSGFQSVTELQGKTVAEARGYCAKTGQAMSVVSTEHNEGPYILGKFPTATVRFKCDGPSKPPA
jgi:hypothetical protein